MHFFLAIEQEMERAQLTHALPKKLSYPNAVMDIHENGDIFRFSISPASPRISSRAIRVVALRNPLDRILSMWVDKAVLVEGTHMLQLHANSSWFPRTTDSVSEIQSRLIQFLKELSDPTFRLSDAHWAPQTTFIKSIKDYNHVVTTRDLKDLPRILALYEHLSWLAVEEMPHFNKSQDSLKDFFITQEARELIHEIYKSDFTLLQSSGVIYPSRLENVNAASSLSDLDAEVWTRNQRRMEINRLEAIPHIDKVYHQQLIDFQNSRIWRLTATYRRMRIWLKKL